ncbi:uncharacterized protein LOC131393926 isoform X1 [Diceros bicornis minor]|uniref:uncharacterized protein LOC131393926 isoform X1 n=1 Tax=Diceros bicornis minor TaxID=77932 RepID=UPI0026EF8876|nr:uncharacterized protein LOC131393926 isoform X1 [Diceros bicornis minor]
MGLERAGGGFLPSVLPTGRGNSAQLPRPGVTDVLPMRWIWRGLSRALKGAAGGRLSLSLGGRPAGTTTPSVQRARSRHARRPGSRRPALARRPPPGRYPQAGFFLPPRPSGSRSTGGPIAETAVNCFVCLRRHRLCSSLSNCSLGVVSLAASNCGVHSRYFSIISFGHRNDIFREKTEEMPEVTIEIFSSGIWLSLKFSRNV